MVPPLTIPITTHSAGHTMFDLQPNEAKLMATYGLTTMRPNSLKDINYHEFKTPPDEVSDLSTEQQYNMLLDLIESEQKWLIVEELHKEKKVY